MAGTSAFSGFHTEPLQNPLPYTDKTLISIGLIAYLFIFILGSVTADE